MNRPKLDPADQATNLANQTFAAEDRAKTMQVVEKEALAVRENMARLRELRLAREAQDFQSEEKKNTTARRKPKKRVRIRVTS